MTYQLSWTPESDRLFSFFMPNNFKYIPRAGDIKEHIMDIANQQMVHNPSPLCASMRKGIPATHMDVFWQHIAVDHIRHLLLKQ